MIWTIIEAIAVFVESFLFTHFVVRYFSYKKPENAVGKSIFFFLLIFIIDMTGTFFIQNEWIFMIGMISSAIIFSISFLKGSIFENVLISLISYFLIYIVNLPVLNIIGIISGTTASEVMFAQDTSRIVCLFCTKILYFFATQCILFLKNKETFHFRFNEWVIVISALFITFMIWFSMYFITLKSSITNVLFLLITLLLLLLNAIIFVFIRKMNIAGKKETEKELLQLQLHQQQKEVQNLEHQYQEMSILRHDFNNKVQCIYTLLKQNNINDAKRYAEKILQTKSSAVQQYIHSSSSVINAIINEKIEKAEKNMIDVSCRITTTIPEYMEYDLSILLANLMDNAIEACQKNTISSQIFIIITETAGYYRIAIKNTIQESVLDKNKALQSNKKDKKHHGWGLKSVHEIVEKYTGSMDVYENEGRFIVSIILLKNGISNMGD